MIREQRITSQYATRKYHDLEIPKINIANKMLEKYGFKIGDKVKVEYSSDKIIITNEKKQL